MRNFILYKGIIAALFIAGFITPHAKADTTDVSFSIRVFGSEKIDPLSFSAGLIRNKDTIAYCSYKRSIAREIKYDGIKITNMFGEHEVFVSYTEGKNEIVNKHTFVNTGREKRVEIVINMRYDSTGVELERLTVRKILSADNFIGIDLLGPATIGSEPLFKVINRTEKEIYGYSMFSEFWGNLYKREGLGWTRDIQPTICGTRDIIPPLKTGDTGIAYVPADFNTEDNVFTSSGEYQFRLLVSDKFPDISFSGRRNEKIMDITLYELVYNFEVDD